MNERKGILFVLATALISGVSIYVNGMGVKFANPYVFTGMKNLLVGLGLLLFMLLMKEWQGIKQLKKKDWLRLGLIGLVGGAVPFLLFFKGLSMTSAAQGGFIHKTLFIYVSFLAIIFLKEKLNKSVLLGLGALLLGNFLFLDIQVQTVSWGDVLILGATLLWAVEIILSKRLLATLSPRIVAWGRMFFGAAFIAVFLMLTDQLGSLFAYNPEQWKWVAITSVLLLGYVYTFYHGLKYTRASVATSVLALGAPITSLIAFVATEGVTWSPQKIGGVGVLIIGIVLVVGLESFRNMLKLKRPI
ncbi:MAG: DMT family transporter [Patescibacteria group bacterium]